MDINESTIKPLKPVWENESSRQKAKIVLMSAIGNTSDVSVSTAQEILSELDRILLQEEEEQERQKNPGL